ncbi:hypothetical protein V8C44DRAFT_351044 [Trichoderma aethiopicum]
MLLLPSSLSSLSLAFQAVLLSAADAHGETQKKRKTKNANCNGPDMWPAIMQTAGKRGSRESPGWMLCFQLCSLEPGPVANKNVSSCRLAPRPDQMVPAWSLATCLSISRLFFILCFCRACLSGGTCRSVSAKAGQRLPCKRPKRSVCHDVASFRWETWDSR